ncbi:MAG: condensation domain-containing protein, partial [Acidobacteriota bacterium]
HGRPVPIGVEGELWVGGAALAHGYVGRPALTAAAFIPDPFGAEPGKRLYRTGDRVRWLPTGVLDFVGRIDRQVKIRGHRVEPGEVEAALAEHPAVRQAVVAPRPDAAGAARLIAWIERHDVGSDAGSDADVTPAELLATASSRLPAAFVPSAVLIMDRMPRTASGKIDRRALPDPERDAATDHVAPRDAAEDVLATIWSEVLGVESPSVTASFFELGGHSLLATRLVARIRDRLLVDLPVRTVFEQPTIATMAPTLAAADRVEATDDPARRAAIAAARNRGELSFGQRRMWFLSRLEPESVAYNLPFPMRLRGRLDLERLQLAVQVIHARHEVLRTRYVADADGEPRVEIDADATLDWRVEDLSAAADPTAAARRAVADELGRPFDLEHGPVVRWRLWRLAVDDHLLLGHAHHIAFDGVSHGIFRAELGTLYDAFGADGRTPDVSALPELALQYADFAARQAILLGGHRSTPTIEHWRRRLAGLEPLELPTDRPRPSKPDHAGGALVRDLPEALAEAVRDLGRRHDRTLFTVLLAAYDVLLHGLTGATDLAVGVPESGRPTSDLEGLIGFFVDTLVLRIDLRSDPTFLDLADQVQTTLLDAREHATVPFEKLVEELQPDRRSGRTPFFQTAFQVQMQSAPMQSAPIDGSAEDALRIEEWPLHSHTAKFDLNCAVVDTGTTLSVGIEYATGLFDQATIDRWLAGFEQILTAVVADPTRRLSRLSPVTDADRGLVARVNAVAADFPAERSLFEQVKAVAARRPDADAVLHRDTAVSWSDLMQRAERIGRDLVVRGVRPADRVGLCAERGTHWIEGMLGILAAGAAYVPLDADYPADRLRLMVEDTEMAALVATIDQADLPGLGSTPVLTLPRPAEAGPDVALPDVTGDFPAYVIFTSGSTGRPKGVIVSQRAVTRLVVNSTITDPSDDQVASQASSPSFDACGFEIWPVLLGGGAVAVIDRQTMLDPSAFAEALDR